MRSFNTAFSMERVAAFLLVYIDCAQDRLSWLIYGLEVDRSGNAAPKNQQTKTEGKMTDRTDQTDPPYRDR